MKMSSRVNLILLALFAFALGELALGGLVQASALDPGLAAGQNISRSGSGGGGHDDDDDDDDDDGHGGGKVRICHFPPGNPSNVQLISVGSSAVPAHMRHHDAICASSSDKNCCFKTSSRPSVCTSFKTDNANCGRCGNVCAAGTTCRDGRCENICPPPSRFCGASGCVNPGSDNNNCGACGNVCAPPNSCVGGVCTNVCSGVCAPGTTFCTETGRCENTQTDEENCGTCGHECAPGETCEAGVCTPPCAPGETLCSGVCVDTQTDEENCGACDNLCETDPPNTCIAGVCTPPEVVASCLPTSSLSVLIEESGDVTAYVPLGSWSEFTTGVHVVPLEGSPGAASTVATAGPVNSCSSNSVTGTTVCTGNTNDVYVINGSTLTSTHVAGATASQGFSGGSCMTCGVAIESDTGLAWIAEGTATPPGTGQLQSFDPATGTFGLPIGLFGQKTSENIAIDPIRNLILSASYNTNFFQVINSETRAVYTSTTPFPSPGVSFALLDSTAEDCTTGIALAPYEFDQTVLLINLNGAVYTPPPAPGTSGTFTAPFNIQSFAPDFANLEAGNSGSAVAPGSHYAVITGEFGGTGFGVLRLPASIGPATVPAAEDWVSAAVPPGPFGVWQMGRDPHTVTAYVSPNDLVAYALFSNVERTYLVKVDMARLLSAPRCTPATCPGVTGTHTANPATIPAGTFTFVAQ